jgi:hypothetical protein
MAHPDQSELLEDAARGALSDAVQAHLDLGCTECELRLETYGRILRALRRGRPADPPAELVERVRRALHGHEPAASGGGLSFLAEPVLLPRQTAAMRGRRMATARRMYRAGPFEIDLASLEGGTLLGQLLPLEPDAQVPSDGACILYPEGEPIVVPLERNGDFRIAHPPAEPYALCIEGSGLRILIEDVRLQAESDRS